MAVENPMITQTVRVLVWESSVFAAEWSNSAQRESFLILNAGEKKQTLLSVVVVTTQLLAAAICKNVFFQFVLALFFSLMKNINHILFK